MLIKQRKRIVLVVIMLLFITAMAFLCFLPKSPLNASAVIDENPEYQYHNSSTLTIDTIDDWARFVKLPSGLNFLNKTVILNCDIDLALYPYQFYTFSGVFEGNNHAVFNAQENLFREIGLPGEVRNLHFYNINIEDTRAAVAYTNKGVMRNVTASGDIAGESCAMVYLNMGVIDKCASYLTIEDSSSSDISYAAGIAVMNEGAITKSYFSGEIIATNACNAGGIAAYNLGVIEECHTRMAIDIQITKSADNLNAGGIAAINGFFETQEVDGEEMLVSIDGIIENCSAVVNVRYSENFNPDLHNLSVSGLIGNSRYTEMSYCYSHIQGQGELFGVIQSSEVLPVIEEDAITGYEFVGTRNIHNCFSTQDLQPDITREIEGGTINEDLAADNLTITVSQLLNQDELSLTDLLQNPNSDWTGGQGQYPVNSVLLEGGGAELNPYIIKTREDIFKLKTFMFNQAVEFYFSQQADIDLGYIIFRPFDMGLSFAGHYDGNDFAVINFEGEALFERNWGEIYNLGFIGGNPDNKIATVSYGSINNCYTPQNVFGNFYTHDYIYGGKRFVLAKTFGYTGSQTFQAIVPDYNFSSGSGTESDPYIVTTANQLAAIGGLGQNQYAALGNDIKVNSSSQAVKNKLNIAGFSGHLDGRGHTVTGLINEPLIGALTGSVSNIKLRGVSVNYDYSGLLCLEIDDMGKASQVTVYGSIYGTSCGGVAGENNGIMEFCANYAEVYGPNAAGIAAVNNGEIKKSLHKGISGYGIAANGTEGKIVDCLDFGESLSVSDGNGILDITIEKTDDAYRIWQNNEIIHEESSINASLFRSLSIFDKEVWGYAVGDSVCPSIKRFDKFHKKDIAMQYFNKLNYDRMYDPDVFIDIGGIQIEIINDHSIIDSVTFVWYYNGELLDTVEHPQIINAGVYELYAAYGGNHYVLEYTHKLTVNIQRAPLPSPDFWGGPQLPGLHTPYYYDGGAYDISQIKAWNLASYGIAEEDYAYTVKKEGATVQEIVDAADYNVEVTIDNPNYAVVTANVTITVSRATLVIDIDDKEINYLEDLLQLTYDLHPQINEGADADRIALAYQSALDAIAQAQGKAVCDYAAGDDIGEYPIYFEAVLDNYIVSVNQGILRVNPIPLSSESIIFEDVTEQYTGFVIPVWAHIEDEEISVAYYNNQNINAGEYEVEAVFSKPNYIDLVLTAVLTITKAPLTIKPSDIAIDYGDAAPDYYLDEINFLGDDDISCLEGEAVFECEYWQGFDAGSYPITVTGLSAANYQIEFTQGTLYVNKKYMHHIFEYSDAEYVYDGQAKDNPIDLKGYETQVLYNYYDENGQLLLSLPVDSGTYKVAAYVYAIDGNHRNTQFEAYIIINQADLEVYFDQQYVFTYNGQNHNLEFNGQLPPQEDFAVTITGVDDKGQTKQFFKDASHYQITAVISGNPNYKELTLNTLLIIEPAELEAIILFDKVYNRQIQLPDYELDGFIAEGDEIEIEWEFSLYGYGYDHAGIDPINAAKYTCYPKSLNANYIIVNTPEYDILKYYEEFSPFYVEFEYGDYIDFVYANRQFTAGRNFVVQRDYFVEETSETVAVEYYYSGPNAGTYDVTGVKDTANYDFELVQDSHKNKIRVIRRELTYEWNATEIETEYNTQAQQPFTIEIGNLVSGESVSVVIKSDGNLKDAGTYSLWAELVDARNYILNTAAVTLKILKAPLTIRARDIMVVEGTESVNFSAEITGLKGDDTLSSMGQQLRYFCGYNPNAPAGTVLDIEIERFVLPNYDITFIDGKLTVTANEYPPMSMSNKSFVYDGKVKALTLDQALPQGAYVSYNNNYKTNVGVYTVTATIYFPNSTKQVLTAILTITKATPVLFVEDIILPYSISTKLDKNDIIGVAKLGDSEVEGSFSWVGDTSLKKGQNEYTVLFTPKDADNLNPVQTVVNVEGRKVRDEILHFDNTDTIISDDKIYIKEDTVITLNEMYENLTLYSNGVLTQSIALSGDGVYTIEVKHKDYLVYSKTFNVIVQKDDDNGDIKIPAGEKLFDIAGGSFGEDGNIVIDVDQVFIELKDEYKSDMRLILNGHEVDFIALYGNEGNANIQVLYKDILVYSRTFGVKLAHDEGNEPPQPADNWLLVKVIGGVAGGIALSVGLFFLIRWLILRKNREYNPYDEVEKRRERARRKFK